MFGDLNVGAIGVDATFEESVKLAVENGFKGIDIDLAEAESIGIDKVLAKLDESGLRVGGWGLPVEFRAEKEEFEDTLKTLPHMAKIAKSLGLNRCNTWVPPGSNENTYETQFDLLTGRFRRCAEILADQGQRLGLEFIGPKTLRDSFRHEFIYRMDQMLSLCEAVGTGNMGLLLDCWHWYTSEGTVQDILALRPEQVVYVHINDAPEGVPIDKQVDNVRRLPMSTGIIDLPGFLKALNQIGYDGPVTAEPFSPELSEMEPRAACNTIAYGLRRGWQEAGLDW